MKVKLTRREPEGQAFYDMHEAGEQAVQHRRKNEVGVVPEETAIAQDVWTATHDAAPDDDATRALEQHLRTVRMVLNGEASLNDLGGSYDALQAKPETADLLRQAEERGGST